MNLLAHPWKLTVCTALEREVRDLLGGLNYNLNARVEAAAWAQAKGTADGCECVEDEDRPAVEAIIMAHRDRLADEARGGDVEADPEEWPSWTDLHTYEPTEAERRWAAAELEGPEPDA